VVLSWNLKVNQWMFLRTNHDKFIVLLSKHSRLLLEELNGYLSAWPESFGVKCGEVIVLSCG